MRRLLLATVLVLASAPPAAMQSTRPATVDDVLGVKAVQQAAISPDGSKVIYLVRQWEAEQDRMEARTHVWMVATSGDTPARQLTFGERGESQPQWSPDGNYISFVAARGGADARAQVYVMPIAGGEAWKLTDAKENVSAYSWSPDSSRIAYVSLDPRSPEEEASLKKRDDERNFEGDFRYQHVWVIDLNSKQATRITEGPSFTVQGLPSWSPDGTRLVFAAAPTPLLRDNRRDIYIADLRSRQVERISTNFGSDDAPMWSPDGTTIAWVSAPYDAPVHADGTAVRVIRHTRLMLYDIASKTITDASTSQFDREAGTPIWTDEGTRVMFITGDRAYNNAFGFDVRSGTYTRLSEQRTVNGISVSKDGRTIAVTMDAPDAATEVYVTDPSFASFKRLTDTNPQLAEIAQGETEVVTWKSRDGVEIEGVLLKPVGYQPGKRYPMLVVAHGGPAGAYVNGFRLGGLEGGQIWAGNGWAVFYPNPRGSTNYGEQVLQANINDWGGGDYHDIMSGVDALIARGIADPDRLAHIGWSYGGYMTAWVITQTTRFKAAMVGAGLTNLWSMYGTSENPSVLIAYFGGSPNSKTLPLYLERSALSHVDKVTTPTLILHGATDERVPVGQAYELYRALKDRGKTTELVIYPREGHGISEYHHQRDRLQRIYDWVTKYTLGSGASGTTAPQRESLASS